MKKVVMFLIIIFIYFGFVQNVYADVDYQVDSIEFNSSGSVTVKGWALIPEVDNYGGYTTRIYVSLVKRNGGQVLQTVNEYGGLVYSGGDTYGTNVGKTGSNDFCYIRTCYKANGTVTNPANMFNEDWTYTENHPNYEFKNGCVYRNSYFTATFDRITLADLADDFYISITIKDRRDYYAFDVCSTDSSLRASASDIISRGSARLGGDTSSWAGRYEVGSEYSSQTATVTKSISSCSFDGTSCNGNETQITSASGIVYNVKNQGSIFSVKAENESLESSGFTTANDKLVYQISQMRINNNGSIYLSGYAYIDGQNNYGGVLTDIKVIAVGGDGQQVSANVGYRRGYYDNISFQNGDKCWERLCNGAEDAFGERRFARGDACFKYNINFIANFNGNDIKSLVTSGEIKFKIAIDYDTVYGSQPNLAAKCTDNNTYTNSNAYLLHNIYSGYTAVRNNHLEKNIVLNKFEMNYHGNYNLFIGYQDFDLGNSNNEYNMYVDGENVPFRVDVRRNSDPIKLIFDEDRIGDLDAADKHLNLVCDVGDKFVSINSKTKHTVTVPVSYNQIEDGCSVTGSSSISADYYMVQSSDLTYSVDKGPIYAGGGFKFGIDFTNTVRWYYGRRVDECKNIDVSGIKGTCKSCSICGSHSCPTESNPDRTCCNSCEHCGCETGERLPDQCSALGLEAAKELYEDKIPRDGVYDNEQVEDVTNVDLPSDSNSVKNMDNRDNDVGEWTCDSVVDSNGSPVNVSSTWHPGEERILVCRHELPNSYITRSSADVVYFDPSDSASYIDGNKKYYIPLKWPGDIDFELLSKSTQLSTVTTVNFSADYKCDIDVEQALYNLEEGGFKFIYRPIDLNNPFPGPSYGDYREMKSNWANWIEDNPNGLVNNYSKEYSVNLMIDDIREISKMPFNYNERLVNYGDRLGYIDHSIKNDGTSNFIRDDFSNLFNLEHPSYFGLGSGN